MTLNRRPERFPFEGRDLPLNVMLQILVAGLAGTLSLGALASPDAATLATLMTQVDEAHLQAGVDPNQALERLKDIRAKAMAAGALKVRLAADVAECGIALETDVVAARKMAEVGLAAASAAGFPPASQSEVLQLRVCRADALLISPEHEMGLAELDEVLSIAASPERASARAMAMLARGAFRIRSGASVHEGQADLIAACRLLDELHRLPDRDRCLWILSEHESRAGDKAEAERLMQQLLDRARERGAVYDQSVYVVGLGQVHESSGRLELALPYYAESLRLSKLSGDRTSIAYSHHQLGQIHLKLDRAREALGHLNETLRLVDSDPELIVRTQILRGRALIRLGRPGEAAQELSSIEPTVDQLNHLQIRREWLDAQRQAWAANSQWHKAYDVLAQREGISEKIELQTRSEQSARMRAQFNRDRDMAEVESLQRLNAQGQRLRQTQGAALAMFVLLLLGTAAFAWTKWRQSRRLQTLALTDELTGLPNRRAVMAWAGERFEQARRSNKPMAVLIVDADRFKLVNDQHGHAVGDEVLRELARRLPAALRRSRDRIGRMGGEEFLGVLPDASPEQAMAIAQRMRESIAASPFDTSVGPLVVTVSIGLALREPETALAGDSLHDLNERADAALYAAKSGGRNQVVMAPTPVPKAEVEPAGRAPGVPIVLRTRPTDLLHV